MRRLVLSRRVLLRAILGAVLTYRVRAKLSRGMLTKYLYILISGHSFLIVYCSLLLLEEGRCYDEWRRQGRRLSIFSQALDESESAHLTDESANVSTTPRNDRSAAEIRCDSLQLFYKWASPVVTVCYVTMGIFALLFDVSFVVTTVYYHDLFQKFLGCVAATLAWWITYGIIYPQLRLSPPAAPK